MNVHELLKLFPAIVNRELPASILHDALEDCGLPKPRLDKVLHRFVDYFRLNPAWGSLHIVVEEGNVRDDDVIICWQQADEGGDEEGKSLALLLLSMSKTQRGKIDNLVQKQLKVEVDRKNMQRAEDLGRKMAAEFDRRMIESFANHR